jgi:hypothetical protein
MTEYTGPERRTVITFTREDSDRLVRLEQQIIANNTKMDSLILQLSETHKSVATQTVRINKIEKLQNWMMGIGSAITFVISTAVFLFTGTKH